MLRSRLEYKILLIIVLALVCGLGLSVILNIQRESRNQYNQHRRESALFAETLMAGFRNVMLAGRAGYVKQLIADARAEFAGMGQLYLFDNEGAEIFAEHGQLLTVKAEEARAAAALASRRSQTTGHTRAMPLLNEVRCQFCHGTAEPVRGAALLSLSPESPPAPALMVGGIFAAAFKQIMISGQGGLADTLLMEAVKIPGLRAAQVYDNTGTYCAFGDGDRQVDPAQLAAAIARFEAGGEPQLVPGGSPDEEILFLPLANEERCYVCHGDDHRLRGVMALAYDRRAEMATSGLEVAAESFATGFRSLMLVESGTHSGQFVCAVRELPFVEEARIFTQKKEGLVEVYVQNQMPDQPPSTIADSAQAMIRRVNAVPLGQEVAPMVFVEEHRGDPYLIQVIPIENEVRCQVCHTPPREGSPEYGMMKDRWKVRTVVTVLSSMEELRGEIEKNKRLSVLIGLVTLLFVWVVLRFFMKRFVIKPISLIGTTAHQIGSGDLRARVQIPSRDELGQLAGQINEMANGLRERFELTKFVSGETLDAVRLSQEGIKLGGERRLRTLFFSDIRGFTAYAEKVEPEQVITMLNTYLRTQTEIVRQYGGDIDKFVGDELVATFDDERERGENMVVRAVRCAYAIQQRVGQLNREFPDAAQIAVGIGINTGPVVLGAMGSEARMDYTVIGDNVNVTARLCSVAEPRQILLSAASYAYIQDRPDIQARQLAPLSVKNKSEPLIVYEVTHVELAG